MFNKRREKNSSSSFLLCFRKIPSLIFCLFCVCVKSFSSKKFRRKVNLFCLFFVSLLEDCSLDYTRATRKSSECEEMASSSEASKAEVNDDTAVTTTSINNNNNPFAREQEKREGHDAEGKNELTSQTPSSSSPKNSDGNKRRR